MPTTYSNAERVDAIPLQVVTVGGIESPELFCERVIEDASGHTAFFPAPVLEFASDMSWYHQNLIVVYAWNEGDGRNVPIFRGYLDRHLKTLENGQVRMVARSTLGRLRMRPAGFKSAYGYDSGGVQTFATADETPFPGVVPEVLYQREARLWQPYEFLQWFYSNLDAWWRSQFGFYWDPQIPPLEFRTVNVYRWLSNETTGVPELTETETLESPIGNQVFRGVHLGDIIDYVATLVPGIQVYEWFTDDLTVIGYTYPQKNGAITATLGYGGYDFRDIGANVRELKLEVSNTDVASRVVGIGANAANTITLMSEQVNGDGALIGLIPDWPIFDPAQTVPTDIPANYKGIQGACAFDYSTGEYNDVALFEQTVLAVMDNPAIGDKNEPDYVFGYEKVGRRWRLPNWFQRATIEEGQSVFIDPRTGENVSFQVHVEMACKSGAEDGDDPSAAWFYEWCLYPGNIEVDWKNKSFTLDEVPRTNFIKLDAGTGRYTIDTERGFKLARVALTFTYSSPLYALYADTYLASGEVVSSDRITAIESGQGFIIPRPDFGYSQLSNNNMPMLMAYRERLETSDPLTMVAQGGKFRQEPLDESVPVTYQHLIVFAFDEKASILAYTYDEEELQGPRIPQLPILTEAKPMRDDSQKLWQVVNDLYSLRGNRPRSFEVGLPMFLPQIRRGMMARLDNLDNFEPDQDVIDSIVHDLGTGMTSFVTTNQPSEATMRSFLNVPT